MALTSLARDQMHQKVWTLTVRSREGSLSNTIATCKQGTTNEDGQLPPMTEQDGLTAEHELLIGTLPSRYQEVVRRVLHRRNGSLVEANDVCTALLACNTAMSYLGSTVQAKAALFYLVKVRSLHLHRQCVCRAIATVHH